MKWSKEGHKWWREWMIVAKSKHKREHKGWQLWGNFEVISRWMALKAVEMEVDEPKKDLWIILAKLFSLTIILLSTLIEMSDARELAQIPGRKYRPGGFSFSLILPKSLMSNVFWGKNAIAVTKEEWVCGRNKSDWSVWVSKIAMLPPIVPTAMNLSQLLISKQEID